MTMALIHFLLLLALMVGSGYLILRLFSRLFDVDMVAAMCWGFKNEKAIVLTLNWCLFYFIAFAFVVSLLMKSAMLWNMNLSHKGGLQGYAVNTEHAKLYDPRHKEYVEYRIGNPPVAAWRFDRTFELVAFYRPFQSGPYQDIEIQNIWISVIFTVFATLGLLLTYVIAYSLAGEYIQKLHLARELSHELVLGRFRELTGYPFSRVLTAVLLFIILSSWIGGSMMKRIKNSYAEEFADTQNKFREEIMARVAPGNIIRGRLINRTEDSQTIHEESSTDIDGRTKYSTRTIDKTIYSVEFKGIVRSEPVYLSMTYYGKADGIPDVRFLDSFFPPRITRSLEHISVPNFYADAQGAAELDFQVNDDYSVFPVRKPEATMPQGK